MPDCLKLRWGPPAFFIPSRPFDRFFRRFGVYWKGWRGCRADCLCRCADCLKPSDQLGDAPHLRGALPPAGGTGTDGARLAARGDEFAHHPATPAAGPGASDPPAGTRHGACPAGLPLGRGTDVPADDRAPVCRQPSLRRGDGGPLEPFKPPGAGGPQRHRLFPYPGLDARRGGDGGVSGGPGDGSGAGKAAAGKVR